MDFEAIPHHPEFGSQRQKPTTMGPDELDFSEYIHEEYLGDDEIAQAENNEPRVQRYDGLTPGDNDEAGAGQR